MKSKTFKKRLVLNKNTIADLNNKNMTAVIGGTMTPQVVSETEEGCPDRYSPPSDCLTECPLACVIKFRTDECGTQYFTCGP